MKYSGIEWIGNIPDNWSLVRLKDVCEYKKEIAGEQSSDYERLALTLNGVIRRAKDDSEGLQPKEFNSYQILRANDFVFKMIDLQNISTSRVGLSPFTGLVSPAYIRFAPRRENQFNDFTYYYLLSLWHNCVFNSLGGDGVRSSLSATDMGNFICPFPSEKTQKMIMKYLKEKELSINSLIENENSQINSLEQYKKALINKVVKNGIKKNVKLVDSGCKWIGMIPERWDVKRAKFVSTSIEKGSGITKEDMIADGNIACVRYGEIYSKYDNFFEECLTRTNLDRVTSPSYFESGDILFAGTGELVEEIGKNILYKGSERCLAGGDIIIMKHNQHPGYLNYAMNSISSQLQKSYGKSKLKVVHISATDISNIYICLPSLEEQKQISDYLDEKSAAINELIEIKKNKIEKLEEYKKSLIYECITGKKEVAHEI